MFEITLTSRDKIALIGGAFCFFLILVVGYIYSPKKRPASAKGKSNGALQQYANAEGYLKVPLVQRIKVTHDTDILRFELPRPDLTLGIDVGQHIDIDETIPTIDAPEGERIIRKYTPVSKVDTKGHFDLLIKVYHPNVHPKFPDGGIMSQYLHRLTVGEKITIKGPLGALRYQGMGKIVVDKPDHKVNKKFDSIGLVGGGTGITPLYQIMKQIQDNPLDRTKVYLLFANKSLEDILMREELDQFKHDDRFQISFTLDKAPEQGWTGHEGFVTAEMLKKCLPAAGANTFICQCGPPMMNKLTSKLLADLGYDKNNGYQF